MKSDPIHDYILKNVRNLGVAAAVGEAWPEAREKLVSGFLSRLDSRLKKKLKGWQSEPWGGRFFVDAYPGYYISKRAWKHYSIGLQCGEHGSRVVLGVSRDTPNERELPHCPPLLEAMQEILPSAKSQAWWEARVDMHSPASDWRTPDVLWHMHKDDAFLAEVADQLLVIADVSERIIDRLARRKPRKSK